MFNVIRQVKSLSNRVSRTIGTFDKLDRLVLAAAILVVVVRRFTAKKEASDV